MGTAGPAWPGPAPERPPGDPAPHQHWTGTTWEPDPLVLDDQALVVNVRGKGLVIVTGRGHAGAVNIVRHAQRLTDAPGTNEE
jgi:7,8-dihydropterin-6-yl-methyl-4-(beta-D-ribofuranosyl)aminobenzene 5'-phosphate synthase